ncbi:MAG TPA: sensor histidine kinase N-terminal domain-containing protein, partial [Rubrivivax sp.]|nr:sensor histidine kinase N-terminal domain-containing protein [Rubrivivax sp.]
MKPDHHQAPATSISRRVSNTLLAWALLWGMALALGGTWAVRHEMSEMQDDTLRSTAEALAATLGALDLHAQVGQPTAAAPLPEGDPDQRVVWQVLAQGSGVMPLRASRGAPVGPLMPTPA